jgi:hypothetical protein
MRTFKNGSTDDPSGKEIFSFFMSKTADPKRHVCKCGTALYCDPSKSYSNAINHVKGTHTSDWLSLMQDGECFL